MWKHSAETAALAVVVVDQAPDKQKIEKVLQISSCNTYTKKNYHYTPSFLEEEDEGIQSHSHSHSHSCSHTALVLLVQGYGYGYDYDRSEHDPKVNRDLTQTLNRKLKVTQKTNPRFEFVRRQCENRGTNGRGRSDDEFFIDEPTDRFTDITKRMEVGNVSSGESGAVNRRRFD
ncbi:hypothetical protein QQP08_023906 [Theobroma cacao]|nr:hypothetical protein QQP08_023906 [Theobroma cacao]